MTTPTTMTVRGMADALLARCHGGFSNEFEHANWLIKHRAEIDALPFPLRRAVLLAHENATHKEFSK